MKQLVFLLCGLWLAVSAYSQKREAAIWKYGNAVTIDFNHSPTRIFNSLSSNKAGSASICDSNGIFQFTANGIYLFVEDGIIHTNLDTIFGLNQGIGGYQGYSGANIIIPYSNPSVYHYFNIRSRQVNDRGILVEYRVDMRKNNGLGEVDTFATKISKREWDSQLATMLHANGKDSWLIAHKAFSDSLVAFLVTDTGFSQKVYSKLRSPAIATSISPSIESGFTSQLKTSPNSELLLIPRKSVDFPYHELYRFNRETGQFYDQILIADTNQTANNFFINAFPDGAFSPDSKLLYIGTGTRRVLDPIKEGPGHVWQFSIENYDSLAIAQSKIFLGRLGRGNPNRAEPRAFAPRFQLGMDGKIYISPGSDQDSLMSIIQCPNSRGASCQLTFRAINLKKGRNAAFFPTLNQTFVRNAGIFQLQANRRSLCQGDTLELSGYGAGAERFQWSVSPAFPASVKLDTLTWQKISTRTLSPGTYTFSCQAFSRCGDVFEKTISVEIKPLPIRPLVSTIQKPVPCKGDSVVFQIQNPQPGYTYFWSTGDTGPVAIARQTGFYALDSVQHPAGCRLPLGDSVGVVIKNALVPPKPQVLSNPTPEICEGQDTWLKLQPQAYTSHWSNNQTGDSIRVDKSGLFWAIHKSEAGCSSSPSDTIQLNVVPIPSLVLLVADSSHCKGREESKSYSYRIQNGGLVNTEVEGGSLTEKTDSTLRISWWAEAPVGIFTLSLHVENRLGCRAPSIRFSPIVNPTSCADLYPLFIPNLITPNKDQRNDQWQLGNLDYHQPVHLTLYNRWGQIIFEASPYKNNWPAGEPSSGSYFYRLRTGQGRELNGWVTVN